MNSILNKASINPVNNIQQRTRIQKWDKIDLFRNKYRDLKVICLSCSWSGLASLSSFREIIHLGLDGDESYRSISIFCPSCGKEELAVESQESIE